MAAAPQQQPQQPSSAAAAATSEQRAPLFTSGVLPVMLQHPAISSDHTTVCRLLCSSKALRSALLQHASGMVELLIRESFSSQAQHSWLGSHGHLLKSLGFEEHLSLADAARLACALQQAAAATPGGLRLREFEFEALPGAGAVLVLQQLPPQHLASLDLTVHIAPAEEQPDPCVQLTARALTGLTNLSILSLCARQDWPLHNATALADAFMPALSGLSRLTSLNLSGCSRGRLSLLPQQLLELTVSGVDAQLPSKLQLGHLTALTRLNCTTACVQEGDVLPPNLLSLDVQDCSATGPLAALTRLTRLELQWMSGNMSVAGLVSGIAGHLQQLQGLAVTYDHEAAVRPAAGPAAVWPAAVLLPALRDLSIPNLPSSMLLGAADAISRLRALTRLELYAAGGGEQHGAVLNSLARAIAGLPRLQELVVCCVAFGRSLGSAGLLSGAATSLTMLTLSEAGLTDHFVSRMFAFGLRELRSLDLSSSYAVSAPTALLTVGCLPHLTELIGLSGLMGGGSEADELCRREIHSVLQHRRRQAAAQR